MNLTKLVNALNKGLREINTLERKLARMSENMYTRHAPTVNSKLQVLEGRINALLDAVEPHEEAGECKWYHTPQGSFITLVKRR